jgi:hypothetical protein
VTDRSGLRNWTWRARLWAWVGRGLGIKGSIGHEVLSPQKQSSLRQGKETPRPEGINLYTVIVTFSDHVYGIDQIEAPTPYEALREFIRTAECLDGCDREMLEKGTHGLLQVAGNSRGSRRHKGVWRIFFDYPWDIEWPDDNPLLGGQVIQTDPNGPTQEPARA